MITIQNWFSEHKKHLTISMTVLVAIAYLSRLTPYNLYNVSMIAIAALGGIPILLRAASALRYKIVSIEFLVSIAVISALFIGEYSEAGIVIWLFSLGDLLEEATLAKSRQSIKDLVNLAPKTALKITDLDRKTSEEVDVDEVEVGDLLLVKTGSQVPVDGSVYQGDGHVNEASITGESKTSHKEVGTPVYAGTSLESGTLIVQAEKVGEDTTFGRLIELVEEAQDSKTKVQKLIDRFSQYYTPFVLLLALVVGFFTKDVRLATTILVLGCPGALVIGVPISTVTGIGSSAKSGIIAKGSAALDQLTKIDTFVFDKTGTLTTGKPSVSQVVNLTGNERDNLQLLASLESESDHPLAKAINAYYGGDLFPVAKSEVVAGRGLAAQVNGANLLVGNERLMSENGIDTARIDLDPTGSHVYLAVNGKLALALAIADTLRSDALEQLAALRKIKPYKFVLLSGDQQTVVDAVARELNFDEAHGSLLPADKAAYIKSLQAGGHQVAFIGDGINDSPALATADLAIAMGSGTDVAIDVSDLVLVKDQFSQLPTAVRFANKTIANMRQNIAISLLTVALLFIGLFAGYVEMGLGMLIHELSILVVTANGMRLLRLT
ncbi:Cadmium-transporting ATPase [Lactobacillus equicursoris 66c]|uniref:Cd(2+)-exporting ATPase n=1 Tax=Lactobacillus equicursoris 66c TaxID=872326 RepID=K0NQM4_9LACO|nr:heavy metal translocating P-type ATPase [Lactobacillus equicursoris]CCK83243.1 Cadmium-transporting ATPase [Lactobacillus equicursoris 66c]